LSYLTLQYNNEFAWIQNSEKNINGLHGNCGQDLLTLLNNNKNVNANKILNKYMNIIYPKLNTKHKVD